MSVGCTGLYEKDVTVMKITFVPFIGGALFIQYVGSMQDGIELPWHLGYLGNEQYLDFFGHISVLEVFVNQCLKN